MHERNVIIASHPGDWRRAGASPCMAPPAYGCPSGAGHQPREQAEEGVTRVCASAEAQAAAESRQSGLLMGLQSNQMAPKEHSVSQSGCICQTVLSQEGTMWCLRQSSAFASVRRQFRWVREAGQRLQECLWHSNGKTGGEKMPSTWAENLETFKMVTND